VAVPVGDELAKAVGMAVCHGPDEVVIGGDSHGDVVVASGLVLGQAYRAVLGVGEAAAGHHVVSGLAGGAVDGVPGRDAAFEPGALDQLGAAVDVAGGEDVPDVGAQVVIDREGSRVAGDSGGVKIEALEVGGPADGGECGFRLCVFGGAAAGETDDDLLAAAFQGLDAGAGDDLEAFGLERLAQRGGNAGSAPGTSRGPASMSRTSAPRSAKMEAIWQPVSAPPITVTRCGRALRVQMS
jgi:hypothetical protein